MGVVINFFNQCLPPCSPFFPHCALVSPLVSLPLFGLVFLSGLVFHPLAKIPLPWFCARDPKAGCGFVILSLFHPHALLENSSVVFTLFSAYVVLCASLSPEHLPQCSIGLCCFSTVFFFFDISRAPLLLYVTWLRLAFKSFIAAKNSLPAFVLRPFASWFFSFFRGKHTPPFCEGSVVVSVFCPVAVFFWSFRRLLAVNYI